MSKERRILLGFLIAGLILGTIAAVIVHNAVKAPDADEVMALMQRFTGYLNAGDIQHAAELLTPSTRELLKSPANALGEAVYKGLKVKTVDHVYNEEGSTYSADVTFTGPDTFLIMAKAAEIAASRETEDLDPIYDEILARTDLPEIDSFCVVRMERIGGTLLIAADETLINTLEGNVTASGAALDALLGGGNVPAEEGE